MHHAILELSNAIGGNKNIAVYGYADMLLALNYLGIKPNEIGISSNRDFIDVLVDHDKFDAVVTALNGKQNINIDIVVKGISVDVVNQIVKFFIGDQPYSVSVNDDKCNVSELNGFTNMHDDVAYTWATNIYRHTHIQRLVTAYQQYLLERGTANVLALYLAYAMREFSVVGFNNVVANACVVDHQDNSATLRNIYELVKIFSKSFGTGVSDICLMTKFLNETHPTAAF